MEVRRQECEDAERRLASAAAARARYEAVLGVVTNEWRGASEAIDALCARVGAGAGKAVKAEVGAVHVDPFVARLLASGCEGGGEGGAGAKRKRGGDADDVVSETAEELEDGASVFDDAEREALVKALRDKADDTKARLAAVLDAVKSSSKGSTDANLQSRLDTVEANRLKLKRDYDALSHAFLRDSSKVKELQAALDEMEVQLAVTRRRLAISKANGGDDTIEGLPKMATAEDARAAGAQIEAKAAAEADKSGGTPNDSRPGTPAAPTASAAELAKLSSDVAELEAKLKHNEKIIDDLSKEKTELALRVRTLGDAQNYGGTVEKTPAFVALNARYEASTTENEKLQEELRTLRRRMDSVMQDAILDRQAAERGEAAIKRLSSSDARADELDARLAHIIHNRDELELKVRSLSEKQEVSVAKEEQIKMLDIVMKENKALKDENTRFKESYAQFDQAKVDKAAAEARVKSLTESLEGKKSSKAADLEKEIASLKEKLAAAEATAAASNAALEEKQAEVMAFVEEIEAISGAYADAQEQSTRLLGRIAASEEEQNKAVSEKIAAQSAAKRFEDEFERVSETAAYYKRDLDNAYARTQELEGQLAEATEAFTKMQQEVSGSIETTERSKAQLRAMEKQVIEVREKLTASENTVATLMKRSEEELAKLEAEKVARAKAEATAAGLKRKCERLLKEGGAKDLAAEVDAYKTILNCNVCQGERQKAVIITRCWHMFCEECVQKRVASRSRKCPGCSMPFAESEVQRIYF